MSKNKQLGMIIDQERCIGCEACTIACKIENNSTDYWIKVETQGGAVKDTPAGNFPNLTMDFLPKLCNHCENPPCVDSCPEAAIQQRDDGIVILEQELCTGCQSCLTACPYNIIVFDDENNLAGKCNFCFHRVDQGLEPFCVICCEGQALYFGDLNDSSSVVSKLKSEKNSYRLKLETETNPKVYYIPSQPKKRL
ncbi:MAG: 4Fe-4S dicluster domain-containing protein [Candidatus Lokiarchaeota archaeon]|nr:4Fe-4S dicluster domain-containing protein [Candidatus Lokiarchaeota archaeon]